MLAVSGKNYTSTVYNSIRKRVINAKTYMFIKTTFTTVHIALIQ